MSLDERVWWSDGALAEVGASVPALQASFLSHFLSPANGQYCLLIYLTYWRWAVSHYLLYWRFGAIFINLILTQPQPRWIQASHEWQSGLGLCRNLRLGNV